MVLGNLLHRYIILTVEVEEAMFGRQIHWQSYLYSFLFTVAFSLFVNWVMFYKLKKIDMVESLKSVEGKCFCKCMSEISYRRYTKNRKIYFTEKFIFFTELLALLSKEC